MDGPVDRRVSSSCLAVLKTGVTMAGVYTLMAVGEIITRFHDMAAISFLSHFPSNR